MCVCACVCVCVCALKTLFCGLRILHMIVHCTLYKCLQHLLLCRNPFLSKSEMDERMEGRKMVKVLRIVAKVKDGDIEGDWVTIGVIVDKHTTKGFC